MSFIWVWDEQHSSTLGTVVLQEYFWWSSPCRLLLCFNTYSGKSARALEDTQTSIMKEKIRKDKLEEELQVACILCCRAWLQRSDLSGRDRSVPLFRFELSHWLRAGLCVCTKPEVGRTICQCPVESKCAGSDLAWRMAIVSHLYLFSRMQYYSLFATPTQSSSSQSSLICTGRSLPLFGVVAAELTCLTGTEEIP